jgi:hypothetical protein
MFFALNSQRTDPKPKLGDTINKKKKNQIFLHPENCSGHPETPMSSSPPKPISFFSAQQLSSFGTTNWETGSLHTKFW